MNSEFYNVALDRVRYSLVWEDSRTLYRALNLRPTDEVLVITSAGCNALSALLAGPRRVTALDLNPVQNHLLSFKCYLIKYHSAEVFQALLGLRGPAQVAAIWAAVAPSLPTVLRHYWAPFFSRKEIIFKKECRKRNWNHCLPTGAIFKFIPIKIYPMKVKKILLFILQKNMV
jgi:S-adenosylmethionine-diacylglycerol 3-amino-3-carboxypropyl transferase